MTKVFEIKVLNGSFFQFFDHGDETK